MKTKRIGCFTGSGLIAGLLTLLFISGVALARGGVLFNPGALNAQAGAQPVGGVASHAETGGHCSACHTAIWESEVMSDRCLACHKDLLTSADNFHAVMLAQSQTWSCQECHTEHNGAQAALTIFDMQRFPHEASGYSLAGHQTTANGANFTCADCHGERITAMDLARCTTCHQEIDPVSMADHLVAFGGECLACHDGIDTYGKAFDHNLQAFPLQGKHATTDCVGCHTEARTPTDLKNAPTDCFSCHAQDDPHGGRFGQDCAQCHTPEAWENATFDHSLAAFSLSGAHTDVACEACHVNGVFKGTPQDCFSCHQADDAHAGQFGQDCAQCHTPEGWENASFDHSLAAFPLTGAHLSVACTDCHTGGVYKGTPQECSACHAEPVYHQGLFGSDCAACHETASWSPALYNQAHTFPFNHGASGISSCRTCHPGSLATYDCYTCHEHNPAEIESKHREEGISNFQDCARCHPTGQKEEGEGGDD
jgi:hypothetical protein